MNTLPIKPFWLKDKNEKIGVSDRVMGWMRRKRVSSETAHDGEGKLRERLPERWYLAALWPQWERQLGRERRLLASTERAAITAPIMLLNYCDNNEANAASRLSENIQNMAGSEQSATRPKNRSSRESQSEPRQKSECFARTMVTARQSEKADRWVLEYVSLCTCVCQRPHLQVCLSLRHHVTVWVSEIKRR